MRPDGSPEKDSPGVYTQMCSVRFLKALAMRSLQNTLTSYYIFFYKKSGHWKIGDQSHKLINTR